MGRAIDGLFNDGVAVATFAPRFEPTRFEEIPVRQMEAEVHVFPAGTCLPKIPDGPALVFDRDWVLSRPMDRRARGAAKDPSQWIDKGRLDALVEAACAKRSETDNWQRWYLGEWTVEVGPAEPPPSR